MVSVIIPIYNIEDYLEACIQSVLCSKDFGPYEILLIDDGSTDSSGEIADAYSQKYSQIQAYHFPNGGPGASRNRGIDISKGDYIIFLDGDDCIEADYICEMYTEAKSKDLDVVVTGFTAMSCDESQREKVQRGILNYPGVHDGECILSRKMDQNDSYGYSWCGLYRREFLMKEDIRFPASLMVFEDVFFVNKALVLADRVSVLDIYGYYYRQRENSLVYGKPKQRDIDASILLLEETYQLYSSLCERKQKVLGRTFFQIISMALYYIGEIQPGNQKEYYRILKSKQFMKVLKTSAVNKTEWGKYLVFRTCMRMFYYLVRKKDAGRFL